MIECCELETLSYGPWAIYLQISRDWVDSFFLNGFKATMVKQWRLVKSQKILADLGNMSR